MRSNVPWGFTRISLPPAGMREACLRIAFMDRTRVEQFAKATRESNMATAARWRLEHPEKWVELLRVMKINTEVCQAEQDKLTKELVRQARTAKGVAA